MAPKFRPKTSNNALELLYCSQMLGRFRVIFLFPKRAKKKKGPKSSKKALFGYTSREIATSALALKPNFPCFCHMSPTIIILDVFSLFFGPGYHIGSRGLPGRAPVPKSESKLTPVASKRRFQGFLGRPQPPKTSKSKWKTDVFVMSSESSLEALGQLC